MTNIVLLQVELFDESGVWLPGTLSISSNSFKFQDKNGQFGRSFPKLANIKVEKCFIERKRLFRRIQETCMKLTVSGESFIFHITSDAKIENVKQLINEQIIIQKNTSTPKSVPSQLEIPIEPFEPIKPSIETLVSDPIEKEPERHDKELDSSIVDEVMNQEEPLPPPEPISEPPQRSVSAITENSDDIEVMQEETLPLPEVDTGTVEEKQADSAENDALESSVLSEEEPDISKVQVAVPIRLTYKRKFFNECERFAIACSERIPEKRTAGLENGEGTYIFDIMNVGYMQMSEKFQFHSMPTYMVDSNGGLIVCREEGIYGKKLFSAYEPFLANSSIYQNEIINLSIRDSIHKANFSISSTQMFCLMPDIVDDFSHVFRNQLEYRGVRLFQIPRSIALAYAVQPLDSKDTTSLADEFLCLDYDGEELIAIKIHREINDDGEPIFVRMGRYPLKGHHPSYRSLAKEYVNRYAKKYSVPLSSMMIDNLIETKLLQKLMLSSANHPIILADGDLVIDIWRDDEILSELQTIILQDAQDISKQYHIAVYSLCCFGWPYLENLSGEDSLAAGCKAIHARFEMGKPLWEEYLPSLQLDVNQDGAFASLELIGEKDRRQQINSAFLGKTVEIIIENGTIVLASNKDYYDLPLEREVYGNMNKAKMARFTPEKPLEEDTEVELHISYSYGDVDSYKLTAVTHSGQTIVSQWCDTDVLKNRPPIYTPVPLSAYSSEDNLKIVDGFREFTSRVKSPYTPRPDMLYSYKREPERPYSMYLRSLNAWGFPFRPVRLYFDADNQTDGVRQQIKTMIDNGTFDCVADVLNGDLPVNHNLDKGSSATFPNTDQASVLRDNLEKICREFGYLYTYQEPPIQRIIEALRKLKPESKTNAIQTWAPITAYITRDCDKNGVWDSFSKALKTLQPQNPLRTVDDLRTISNVCYLTQNWIFEFYHCSHGRKDVDWLLRNIASVLYFEEWNQGKEYNARKVRDVLELLLCVCMLKKEDPTILDCNAAETKRLVKQLKKIDQDMRSLETHGMLKQPFNSRIQGYNVPVEYKKVNPVIYCLVQTLTGGESINLVGFRDD